jgi:hypothetical protein
MNQQNQPEKSRRRLLIIVAIVLIAIVVVAIGVYALMQGGGGGATPSASPTSTPAITPTPTVSGGGLGTIPPSAAVTPTPTATATISGGRPNVAGASSLQFSVTVTNSSGTLLGTYTYYAKNAGTSNLAIRIEMTDTSGSNVVYIVNGALQKAWLETGGQWTDLSSSFTSTWSTWNQAFTGYQNSLAGWAGNGDWTYNSPSGESVRVYNISVNPSLPDSLFTH